MSLEREKAAFLHNICAKPDDGIPRLIYADWLDQHIDRLHQEARNERGASAHAEFIRLQCLLAQMPENGPLRAGLQSEADKLLNAYRDEWMKPLHAIMPGLRDEDVTFSRGFPSGVILRRVEELEHVASLVSIAPLQEVHLDLSHKDIGYEVVEALAQSPNLQYLTHLNLCSNRMGDAGT